MADGEKELVGLAKPLKELDTDVWILTHPALKGVARIKALSDFLYESFARAPSFFTPPRDSVRVALPASL